MTTDPTPLLIQGWTTPEQITCARCQQPTTPPALFDLPTIWINTETRTILRPDSTFIQPGEPGTSREPICPACALTMATMLTAESPERIIPALYPHARWDKVHEESFLPDVDTSSFIGV